MNKIEKQTIFSRVKTGIMKSLAVGLFYVLAFACSGEPSGDGWNAEPLASQNIPSKEMVDEGEQSTEVETERKLIKRGRISFETKNVKKTREFLAAKIDTYNAYVSSENTSDNYHNITVRIPSNKFDEFVQDVTDHVDYLDDKEINTEDVTEEFLDVEARLQTKKELEQRYISFLAKAKTVDEILKIEREITNLRGEIESMEGRLKFLQNQVGYSTLRITFYKEVPSQTRFSKEFTSAFRNGWNGLIWFLVGLVNIWPFLIIFTLFILGIRLWNRKRKRKNQPPNLP